MDIQKLDVKAVRKRKSYKEFQWLLEDMDNCTPFQKQQILWKVFDLLDDRRAYKYNQQARYAHDSLHVILADNHIQNNNNKYLFEGRNIADEDI